MLYGGYAFQHTGTILTRFQVRNHISLLQTIADCIREHSFYAVTCLENDGALCRFGNKLYQESVVFVLFSQSPVLEQVGGKHAGIVIADTFNGNDGNFYSQAVFYNLQQAVDAVDILRLYDSVGVAHVIIPVGKTYVRYRFDCIIFCRRKL